MGFKLALFPTSFENLTVEMSQISEDMVAPGSFIDDVILPEINNGNGNANQADGNKLSSVMEHKVARNFRGQHEEVKKNAPKIIKMLSTSDVRVKRSTAFESTRDAEMMQDSAVTMTSDSSTRSSDFTEAPGLSQDVSKSETNLTSENANLLNTTQTLSQSENVSKNLTAATVTATETTTKSPVNQNDSESNQVDCPLRIYPAILGVFTGNKIYGLLKKPCGDHNKPPEYDQDYVGFILQTIEEFLKDSVHFTSQLLSNISKFVSNLHHYFLIITQFAYKCFVNDVQSHSHVW